MVDPATETIEAGAPTVVLRKEYVTDTAGPGFNRGGAAVRKDTMYLTAAEHWTSPVHTQAPAGIGANGGDDGTLSAVWLFEPERFDVVDRAELLPISDEVYALAQPVAGVLEPQSNRLDPEGEYAYFASSPVWRTAPRSVFRCQTGGGGGWGEALQRDPLRVLEDVRDEYISIDGAARAYGVVVVGDPHRYPERLQVDQDATHTLRERMRAAATEQ